MLENIDGVESDGKISSKGRQDKQKVQRQKRPSILPLGKPLHSFFETKLCNG